MTVALATRMMIETGKQLIEAIDADDAEQIKALTTRYLDLYVRVSDRQRDRALLPASDDQRLTSREVRVVALARNGYDTKTIAAMLTISTGTVKAHLRNARKKAKKEDKA